MELIISYLNNEKLSEDPAEARKVKYRAAKYTLVDGILYRKAYLCPLLRCLTPSETNYVLREVHEGICGSHVDPRNLARKVLLTGYYWPTLHSDADTLVWGVISVKYMCQYHENLARI
ncbi:hypothetical protein ACH5RR_000368 [Cinchona calisaya]|uniref:Integrase zinc-binding domain-containing protein n=1 Tax=Cinchona calisaya TaxID=153742 RepID=A0ABD3B0G1_9GENT